MEEARTNQCLWQSGLLTVTGESSIAEIHFMPVFPVKQSFQNIKGEDRVKRNQHSTKDPQALVLDRVTRPADT